jgi:hypothetical protein
MPEQSRTITYRGPAPFVSLLAQMLEEEGASVEWEPPIEERGAGEMAQDIVSQLIATGAAAGIAEAIRRFREWTKGKGDVTQDDDDTGDVTEEEDDDAD